MWPCKSSGWITALESLLTSTEQLSKVPFLHLEAVFYLWNVRLYLPDISSSEQYKWSYNNPMSRFSLAIPKNRTCDEKSLFFFLISIFSVATKGNKTKYKHGGSSCLVLWWSEDPSLCLISPNCISLEVPGRRILLNISHPLKWREHFNQHSCAHECLWSGWGMCEYIYMLAGPPDLFPCI